MSDYPKIMRHGNKGVVVRFASDRVGTVIGEGHGDGFSVGYESTEWNMEYFKDYKPAIHKTKG